MRASRSHALDGSYFLPAFHFVGDVTIAYVLGSRVVRLIANAGVARRLLGFDRMPAEFGDIPLMVVLSPADRKERISNGASSAVIRRYRRPHRPGRRNCPAPAPHAGTSRLPTAAREPDVPVR